MSGQGRVVSVDRVTAKSGEAAWQIVTDYDPGPAPDGLRRCAVWIRRDGPRPEVGETVAWGPRHAWWGSPETRARKIGSEFDPNDPALFTG